MATARSDDPLRQERLAVFEAWGECPAIIGKNLLTSEIIDFAEQVGLNSWIHATLRDALLAVAAQRGVINSHKVDPKRLGKWLKLNTDNIAGDYKLAVDRSDKVRPRWRLERKR